MTRKELALKVRDFMIIDLAGQVKESQIWEAIACTDDRSLLSFYESKTYVDGVEKRLIEATKAEDTNKQEEQL
ncbi:MAG: hypothetical protein J6F30_12690 [Cellulosilyticum sp.]|nr:hypothetical protein [Cellulosilyticum sp.]